MLLISPPNKILSKEIDTGFYKWIKIGRILESNLRQNEKASLVLLNTIGEIPQEPAEWIEAILDFYCCGRPVSKSEPKNKVLDWEKDSATIWADFRGYFGIDLDKENFHWWEFMALFESLPKDCAIKRIMGIRAIDLSKIKDPEIRAEYEEQKRLVALEAPENDFWDE